MMLFRAIIVAAVMSACVASAQIVQFSGAPISVGWNNIRIGAGGYIRGGGVANDGTLVARADTYGGYVLPVGATKWIPLLTAASMPAGSLTVANSAGLYEIAIAPSNSQIIYMIYNGYLYASTNRGASFTQTNMSQMSGPPGTHYASGPLMAVDLQNANVVYVASPSAGVQYTTGGSTGGSFTQISTGTIPAGTGSNGNAISFDPSDGTGNTVYIFSYGTGAYKCTSALTSPSCGALTLTSSPTTFRHAMVDASGIYWVVDDSTGAINYYTAGTWAQPTSSQIYGGNSGFTTIAVDPNNTAHIVATGSANLNWTNDSFGGTAAPSANNSYRMSEVSPGITITGDTPWLNQTGVTSFSTGIIVFDPHTSGQLDMFGGQFGFAYVSNPLANNNAMTMNVIANGIEQLVPVQVLAPEGTSNVVLMSEDLPVWYKAANALNAAPTSYIPSYGNQTTIVPGYSADWAAGTPSTIVAVMEGGGNQWSGISTNGGASWTKFGAVPSGVGGGGNICASSASNFVWAIMGGAAAYSANGGASWTASTGLGANFSPGANASARAQILQCDKQVTTNVYAYVAGNGFYKSVNNGQAYTVAHSGAFDIYDAFDMTLACSPLVSEQCFYTSGFQNEGPTYGHPVCGVQMYATTNLSSWSAVTGFYEVTAIGFGAQVSGQSYASITVAGWHGSGTCNSTNYTYGVWQSMDNGTTWTNIGVPSFGVSAIGSIDCDKQIQGQCYAALGATSTSNGAGFQYYVPWLLKRDLDPASNDNSPAWLAKVS